MEGAPGAREGKCIIPHDALTPFKDTRWLPALFLFSPYRSRQRLSHRSFRNIHSLLWIPRSPPFIVICNCVKCRPLFNCVLLRAANERNVNIASVSRLLVRKRIRMSNPPLALLVKSPSVFFLYNSKQTYWLVFISTFPANKEVLSENW